MNALVLTVKLSKLSIQPNDCVLDLGCGEGRHTIGVNYEFPDAHVFGVDLNLADIQTAQKKHRDFSHNKQYVYLQANGFTLPFANESFDHIICSEVLEHIENYPLVLAEIQRVLKPNGHLCVSVPRAWPERICWALSDAYHQVPGGHVRIFNIKKLRSDIQQLGFQFTQCHWAHALHAPYWWLRCLFWRDNSEQHTLVKIYHRFLVWDMMKKPWFSQTLEKILNPICGKSTVLYFKKSSNV
jgi:SAM-dependent methyltransferase